MDPNTPAPGDYITESLQKINSLFFGMATNPSPELAPLPTDEAHGSLQKINQLVYNMSEPPPPPVWQDVGTSSVQYRLEANNVCRFRGEVDTTGIPLAGFPIPESPPVFFAPSGATYEGTPRKCVWELNIDDTGTLYLTMVYPDNVPEGGECWFDGFTYVHA
jgi:hypothetical protein